MRHARFILTNPVCENGVKKQTGIKPSDQKHLKTGIQSSLDYVRLYNFFFFFLCVQICN